MMTAPLLMGAVANSPSPVRERPTRYGLRAALRGVLRVMTTDAQSGMIFGRRIVPLQLFVRA
jgi:hypothetical protein